MRLHYHTLKYLSIGILLVLSLWVALFYTFLLDEVYDNIDDGLKNAKIEIIKKAYDDPSVRDKPQFGLNNFRITSLPPGDYPSKNSFKTEDVFLPYDDEQQPMRILTTYFKDSQLINYKLEIRTSTIEADELLQDFGLAVLGLFFMLLISIFIINYIVLRRVWTPFYDLLDKLKKYHLGQSFTVENNSNILEFQTLETEIQKMISNIENTYTQQKMFISNAAHETQTPLAIATNKLELLVEESHFDEQQIEQLNSIHQSLNRLIKLNRSLLMLSKIENHQYNKLEPVDFNALILNTIQEFEDIYLFKGIEVSYTESTPPLIITMDRGLAITLINNLFKNAINHNHQHGNIQIVITPNSLTIKNTSTSSALDENLIYNRFYRTNTNDQSTGLGLALVKTICRETKGLSVHYNYQDNYHCFEILYNI
ncbi:sensor histidine kinase [Myroides pelagicus]|uniref:histidine kinase n=1 Tax=Myroides pelagicus TaxID=270914 RepID=A0A7K1GL47_9FLAO|nr:HAMP domain-containing sensor histidine kinase [Myroides pelagicus]MEC4113460.1 HAMP domain-containing sensor histidine kinase [Myroides pelagicus]MTH29259.1 sensor histidine kinase [Myroides pelagicus]